MANTKKKLAVPTPEEREAAIKRAFAQKRASIAEGVLFNLAQNPSVLNAEPKEVADSAVAIADAFMESLYSVKEE